MAGEVPPLPGTAAGDPDIPQAVNLVPPPPSNRYPLSASYPLSPIPYPLSPIPYPLSPLSFGMYPLPDRVQIPSLTHVKARTPDRAQLADGPCTQECR